MWSWSWKREFRVISVWLCCEYFLSSRHSHKDAKKKHKLISTSSQPISITKTPPKPSTLQGHEAKFALSKSTSFTTNTISSQEQNLEIFEQCYMRLGKLRFRQHWLQREVSESLSAAILFGVTGMALLVGFMGGWLMNESRRGACGYMPVLVSVG